MCDVTMFSSKLVNYDYAILFDTKFTVFGLFLEKLQVQWTYSASRTWDSYCNKFELTL